MIFSSRPPTAALVISADGAGEASVQYLVGAGFRASLASRVPADAIVERTLAVMPDLILLDDDPDGETTERLKADRRTAGIPIIVLADFFALSNRTAACETLFACDGSSTVPQ